MSNINNEADMERVQDWLDKFANDKVLNAHIHSHTPVTPVILHRPLDTKKQLIEWLTKMLSSTRDGCTPSYPTSNSSQQTPLSLTPL